MSKKSIEAVITDMVEPIATELNLELVDVEFVKEGPNWYLRIFIDKQGGVDVEDCQAVSRAIDPLLDEKDPIPQAYSLEVSSPGIDRPLKKDKDFEKYKGQLVKISAFSPIDGQKVFVGELVGLEDNEVVITVSGQTYRVPRSKISSVRLEVQF